MHANVDKAAPLAWPIAAVERDTGLSKETLRMWERRYGFPLPLRDAAGGRSYPSDQLDRLRQIKRLLDAGHRPGRVVGLAPGELDTLLQRIAPASSAEPADAASGGAARECVELLRKHHIDGVRAWLASSLLRQGLERFVVDTLVPLHTQIGEAWMRGEIAVFEEHAYSECVQMLLRQAIGRLMGVPDARRPSMLLTTLPSEPHGLGLLMVEALCVAGGCRCISLGTQTPVDDIIAAAQAFAVDVVALSFTACQKPAQISRGLVQLRAGLPAASAVWVGGAGLQALRRLPAGVERFSSLRELVRVLGTWHREPGAAT